MDWYFSDNNLDRSPYNLYDIFEVFIYTTDRRVKIISNYNYLFDHDPEPEEYITEYNLQITEFEFIEIVKCLNDPPLVIMTRSTDRITL